MQPREPERCAFAARRKGEIGRGAEGASGAEGRAGEQFGDRLDRRARARVAKARDGAQRLGIERHASCGRLAFDARCRAAFAVAQHVPGFNLQSRSGDAGGAERLRGEIGEAVGPLHRAAEAHTPADRAKAVRAHRRRSAAKPRVAAPAVERLGQRRVGEHDGVRDRDLLLGADDLLGAERAFKMRLARANRQLDGRAAAGHRAIAEVEALRRRCGEPPVEAAGEVAAAFDREAYGPELGVEPHRRILHRDDEVRQSEGLAGGRRQQPVDRAEADDAVDQPPAQPDAAGADGAHTGAAKAGDDVDLRPVGGKIGSRRIADADVLEPLGAQADPRHDIARGHAAALELAVDEVARDRLALGPDAEDRQRHQRQQDEHEAPRAPSAPSGAYALRLIRQALRSVPLAH